MNDWSFIKKSITPLNIILLLAVLAGLFYTFYYLAQLIQDVSLPRVSATFIEDQVRQSFEAGRFNPKSEVAEIEKNLFHPERKVAKRRALSLAGDPQIVLYGTFITPDFQLAYLEDSMNPQISNTGASRQQVMKKDDRISGFVLEEILPDKVLLSKGNEKIWVVMNKKKDVPNAPASSPGVDLPSFPKVPTDSSSALPDIDTMIRKFHEAP